MKYHYTDSPAPTLPIYARVELKGRDPVLMLDLWNVVSIENGILHRIKGVQATVADTDETSRIRVADDDPLMVELARLREQLKESEDYGDRIQSANMRLSARIAELQANLDAARRKGETA